MIGRLRAREVPLRVKRGLLAESVPAGRRELELSVTDWSAGMGASSSTHKIRLGVLCLLDVQDTSSEPGPSSTLRRDTLLSLLPAVRRETRLPSPLTDPHNDTGSELERDEDSNCA